MTDPNAIKVMCIFEAGSRLRCESELVCLAANIYHRFFREKEKTSYDIYAIATASLKLAHRFFEVPCNEKNLILSMISIIHGLNHLLDKKAYEKLRYTVCLAERIIATNLEYKLNFKDERMITPGQLQEQYRNRLMQDEANRSKQVITLDSEDESSSSSDDDDGPILKADMILSKNSKHSISSHRYLLHYLKTIKLLLRPDCQQTLEIFRKISNTAWIILCDYHWSPSVTNIYANHLACACLMMAIETNREFLVNSKSEVKSQLWSLLNKKWNLIFCDDFPNAHRDRTIDSIVSKYNEYEQLMQTELNMNAMSLNCSK